MGFKEWQARLDAYTMKHFGVESKGFDRETVRCYFEDNVPPKLAAGNLCLEHGLTPIDKKQLTLKEKIVSVIRGLIP